MTAAPDRVAARVSGIFPSLTFPIPDRRGSRAVDECSLCLGMSTTKQLARTEWNAYFDRFTREQLQGEAPGAATIEVVSPTLGDQFQLSAVRLLGLTYDPKSDALEVLLENVDHLIFRPTEIWVMEGEPGFISTLENRPVRRHQGAHLRPKKRPARRSLRNASASLTHCPLPGRFKRCATGHSGRSTRAIGQPETTHREQ